MHTPEPHVAATKALHVLVSFVVLLLAACSSVTPAPRDEVVGGNAQIRGTVVTDNHAILRPLLASSEHATALSLAKPAASSEMPLQSGVAPSPGSYKPGELVVVRRPGPSVASALSHTNERALERTVERTRRGESVTAAMRRLERDPDVVHAAPNYYLYPTGMPADPRLAEQWALASAGIPVAWGLETGASNPVVVAVIDTGFDLEHEDLAGRFLPGYDFCADDTCDRADDDPGHGSASNWHGTHVAGVIAASGGNGRGIAGGAYGANVRLLPIKIFNDDGAGANTDVLIRALRWAVGLDVPGAPRNPHPAQIINLSIAGDFPSEILQATFDEVRGAGALVVASTGNAGVDRVMSPAAAQGVLAVGSINGSFRRSCFSNHGVGPNGPGGVDLVAAGGESNGSHVDCGIEPKDVQSVLSAIPGDAYAGAVGTSMAAPLVSAVAALVLSAEPHLAVDELEARLLESAYFDADTMTRSEYGSGVLRAERALGLPGPGDSIDVRAVPDAGGDEHRASVRLRLDGSSSEYRFDGLPSGRYSLQAGARQPRTLYSEADVALAGGSRVVTSVALQVVR